VTQEGEAMRNITKLPLFLLVACTIDKNQIGSVTMNSTIAKYIYYAIIVGVACNVYGSISSQGMFELLMLDGVYSWYFQLGFLGNVCMCFAAVAISLTSLDWK